MILESAAVTLVGVTFALIANSLSSKGLNLSENYFPGVSQHSAQIARPTQQSSMVSTNKERAMELLAQRLKKHGIQLVNAKQAAKLYKDLRYEQELYVFIDARNDKDYAKGHIPNAYQFDRYYAERHFSTVLTVCQTAEKIIVYCDGGDCDDSEFTAITLKNAGIPEANISVYGGGLKEWITNGMPVEIGARKSGNLANPPNE